MKREKFTETPLEKWLRIQHMSTEDFCKKCGFSRQVAYRVKKGEKISVKNALTIIHLTGKNVIPIADYPVSLQIFNR